MGNCCKTEFRQALSYDNDTAKRTFVGQTRFAKVVKVYDGDTITIVTKLDKNEQPKRYNLRLSGIDAPEKKLKNNVPNRQLHIDAAKQVTTLLTQKLGGIGSVIYVEFDAEEKYGRLMGKIWRVEPNCCGRTGKKTLNINNWLLVNALVLPYDGRTKDKFSNEQLRKIINFKEVLYQ